MVDGFVCSRLVNVFVHALDVREKELDPVRIRFLSSRSLCRIQSLLDEPVFVRAIPYDILIR